MINIYYIVLILNDWSIPRLDTEIYVTASLKEAHDLVKEMFSSEWEEYCQTTDNPQVGRDDWPDDGEFQDYLPREKQYKIERWDIGGAA